MAESTSLLVWNVRGLNSRAKCTAVRQVVVSSGSGACMVGLQESKLNVVSPYIVLECCGPRFDSFFFLPCGGIIVACGDVVTHSNPHVSTNAVTACVTIGANPSWWLTIFCWPQSDVDKILFLQELRDIRDLHAGPWLVAGDFNLILDPGEKSNENINKRLMGKVRRWLRELELKELYLNGRRYTWSNEREVATLEKLDRVLSAVDWELAFPNSFLSALSTSTSDHCPLLVALEAQLQTGRRFFFESFWPKVDGFQEVVQAAWNTWHDIRNPFKRLGSRLRVAARKLWS